MKKYFFIFVFLFSAEAFSESFLVNIEKQQEKKTSSRWTLSDWLAQKERVALMDQWLAMNTEEIGLEASFFIQSLKFEDEFTANSELSKNAYEAMFIYRFFGFGIGNMPTSQYTSMTSGYFMFRVLGSSNQSTKLNLIYGSANWNKYTGTKKVDLMGANFQFYLFDFLGFVVSTEHYGNSNSIADGAYTGRLGSGQVFIESGFIRIFYRTYTLELNTGSQLIKDKGNGLGIGFQF